MIGYLIIGAMIGAAPWCLLYALAVGRVDELRLQNRILIETLDILTQSPFEEVDPTTDPKR